MNVIRLGVYSLSFFKTYLLSALIFPLGVNAGTTNEFTSNYSEQLGEGADIAQVFSDESDDLEEETFRITYLGVGGTIGLADNGDTPIGNGGFSLAGRISFTENISIHTASVIGSDSLFSLALTGGAPIRNSSDDNINFFPFVGAGLSAEIDDFTIAPLISAGVDIPINELLTGTARVNTNFADDGTDVGLVLGVGVNIFRLF
ncbi:MAG: hypothetical protein AB4050_00350 [Synechococcus sp.]